jgi:hypothetical protein
METAIGGSDVRDAQGEVNEPDPAPADGEPSGACPVRAPARPLDPTERLFVPNRKRLSHSYIVNDAGGRELQIDYGLKEITFDDERFFAFGEQLVTETVFTGQAATSWGAGYEWSEIQPLLETLLAEGIVKRGDGVDDPRGTGLVESWLPPSVCPVPRSWSLAECEDITRDLGGRAVEVGYLEAVVPIYRIAHPALDGDGRQVGEANVFPQRLRLEHVAEWRVCQYAGSRYRDDAPMNITALKAMIKHWKPIMVVTLQIRDAVQARLGLPRNPWTIGDLHVLSSVVLALPAFQLLLRGGSSPQPPLHPVLSSLFRITDGIRMTTDDALFQIDHVRDPGEPMTAADMHAFAEHYGLLISRTGVCAGPKHLIDEFLVTAVDGVQPEGLAGLALPAEVTELLSRLPDAIDYGLHGMQVWGVSLSVYLAMSRAYEALLAVFEPAAAGDNRDNASARLCSRLRADWAVLVRQQITLAFDREVHRKMYANAYERSRRALRTPVGPATLAEVLEPGPAQPMHAAAAEQLGRAFRARFPHTELDDAGLERVVDTLIQYLREEQAILATTLALQEAINALLERPRPQRPLGVRDFLVNYMMGAAGGGFPYLFTTFEDELGILVDCTASAIEVSDLRGR